MNGESSLIICLEYLNLWISTIGITKVFSLYLKILDMEKLRCSSDRNLLSEIRYKEEAAWNMEGKILFFGKFLKILEDIIVYRWFFKEEWKIT